MTLSQSPAVAARPLYAQSFGYSIAMRVMQSELYGQLDEVERAECDELIARGQARPAHPLGELDAHDEKTMELTEAETEQTASVSGLQQVAPAVQPDERTPPAVGEKFVQAWIDLAELPGGMMQGNRPPYRFGPVPGTQSCVVTTSPTEVERWRLAGKPILMIEVASAPTTEAADARDARRYRLLRSCRGQEHDPLLTVQHELDGLMWGGDLDAAVDSAGATPPTEAAVIEPTKEDGEYVTLRVKRPEGYEDVHPDLLVQDMNINPAFEVEVIDVSEEGKTR